MQLSSKMGEPELERSGRAPGPREGVCFSSSEDFRGHDVICEWMVGGYLGVRDRIQLVC